MEKTYKKNIDSTSDKKDNKIAVITKPKELTFLPYNYNSLGPDEVLVEMIGCGLDHTDILLWEGRDWINYPLPSGVPGREGWGIVLKAGDLTTFKPGDTVAVFASNALASQVICKHDKLHKIPAHFQKVYFPAKAFAYAVNIFNRARITEDQVITVLGNGFVSSLLCYFIKQTGATALKVANGGRDENAEETYKWDATDKLIKKSNDLTDGKGCHRIIECTGTQIACDLATSLLREEGKLVLGRKSKDKMVKINVEDPCGLDIIFAYDQDLQNLYEGVNETVRLVEEGKLNPEKFIAKQYPFSKLRSALDDLCSDVGEYKKICITF